MCNKSIVKKAKVKSRKKVSRRRHDTLTKYLGILYNILIVLGILILAGMALTMRIETPVVWAFLYGGWAALTHLRKNLN